MVVVCGPMWDVGARCCVSRAGMYMCIMGGDVGIPDTPSIHSEKRYLRTVADIFIRKQRA